MRRHFAFLFVWLFGVLSAPLVARASQEQWKAIEVKHTTAKPGLDVTQQDLDYLYQGVLKSLRSKYYSMFHKWVRPQVKYFCVRQGGC